MAVGGGGGVMEEEDLSLLLLVFKALEVGGGGGGGGLTSVIVGGASGLSAHYNLHPHLRPPSGANATHPPSLIYYHLTWTSLRSEEKSKF